MYNRLGAACGKEEHATTSVTEIIHTWHKQTDVVSGYDTVFFHLLFKGFDAQWIRCILQC